MYVAFTNKNNESGFPICGFLTIDNADPIKVQKIRVFEFSNDYHTIKYKSSLTGNKFEKTFSQSFKSNDVIFINVYASSSGIYSEPEYQIVEGDKATIDGLKSYISESSQLMRGNYNKAKDFVYSMCDQYASKYHVKQDVIDNWKNRALSFLNSLNTAHCDPMDELANWIKDSKNGIYPESASSSSSSGGCYVATCVYGSYDCPQVWTLRRYRDYTLADTIFGRIFIKIYYAVSPTAVKLFGNTKWFKKFFRAKLDKLVLKLQSKGVEGTPYSDKKW